MKRLVIALFALIAGTVCVRAESYRYDHNGSLMWVHVTGDEVSIVYDSPRDGLRSIGVSQGTELFIGTVRNGYLEGMSRIFSARCGEIDYFVYGDFTPGRSFTLTGSAPILASNSCRIVDNRDDVPNGRLYFASMTQSPAPRAGCVTGVSDFLNVRVGPGSDHGRIDRYAAGTCGIVIVPRTCQNGWCLTRLGDRYGWVAQRYISR